MDRLTCKPREALSGLVSSEAGRIGLSLGTVDKTCLRALSDHVREAASQAEENCGSDPSLTEYRWARQLEALVRKNPHLEGTTVQGRRQAALDIFFDAERRCKRSNRRLEWYMSRPQRLKRFSPLLHRLIDEARWEIYRLLGPGPSNRDVELFWDGCNFGSGSSGGLGSKEYGKTDVDLYAKLLDQSTLSYTPAILEWYGSSLCKGAFGRDILRRHYFGVLKECSTQANQVVTVPKDCDKDRVIAVEPMLNMYCQQGWKTVLSQRLISWGITLEDQSRNQELAREASIRGFARDSWSTIDLSSASDTVSINLVKWFLPSGWFDVLSSVRCSEGIVDDITVRYEKFSSMGNAVTFPLQCLLFCSIIRAARRIVGERMEYRVYGDDLIVPVSCSLLVIEALRFLGFVPNVAKTYVTGHFRESCGADFFFGKDVRPCYLKRKLDHPTAVYDLFNRLQQKYPAHPLLDKLYSLVQDPIIGPELRDSTTDSHFVAPVWIVRLVHGRERVRRTALPIMLWCEKKEKFILKDVPLQLQQTGWKIPTWTLSFHSRVRRDPFARYLSALFGSFGDRHGVRGTSVLRRREAFQILWEERPTWLNWHSASLGAV